MTMLPMIHDRIATPAPVESAYDEYYVETGIRPSYIFAGSSLTEQTKGDVTLTAVGTPAFNQTVVDTLDNPGKSWSHAYKFDAGSESYDSDGTIDFGSGSVLLHVTAYGPWPGAGVVDLAGNEDVSNGLALQTNSSGDILAFARVGGLVGLTLMGSFVANTWFDACIVVDREDGQAGQMRLGTVDQELVTGVSAIGAGTLNSARPFSIGSGRVTSFLGSIMVVRLAFGDQVRGVSPKAVCQATAKQIWWDQVYSRVTSGAK